MKPSLEYLNTRIRVDVDAGKVFWIDATKHHRRLNGKEAGTSRTQHSGKSYWHVKVDSYPLKRSHIVFLFSTGNWPTLQIDHINGNSLDDRVANIREATATQNAWNHKGRAKTTDLPMGIRELPSGMYQARIAKDKTTIHLGSFPTLEQAVSVYQNKRKELFREFA